MNSVEKPSESRATLALGLGVVGLVGSLIIPSIGAVIGALAVVFGVLARRRDDGGRSKATAGVVLGAIAVVVGVVSTVLTATGHWG